MGTTSKAVNWIADNLNASQPPPYFLQRIYDYDAMLVVFPSRDTPGAYVVARRKQFGPGLTQAGVDSVYSKQDTKMCILNHTVPVCLMLQNGFSWDPSQIIAKLAARDVWAHGGGDKAADLLEEQEAAEEAQTKVAIRADMYDRSGDAWRSYQSRTGQSTIRFHDYIKKQVRKVGALLTGNGPQSAAKGEVAAPTITAGARSTAGLGSSAGFTSGD